MGTGFAYKHVGMTSRDTTAFLRGDFVSSSPIWLLLRIFIWVVITSDLHVCSIYSFDRADIGLAAWRFGLV